MLSIKRLFRKAPRATSKTPDAILVPSAPLVSTAPSAPVSPLPDTNQSNQPSRKLSKRFRRGLKKAWTRILCVAEKILLSYSGMINDPEAHRARRQLMLQSEQAKVSVKPISTAVVQSNSTVTEVDQSIQIESPIETINSPVVQPIATGPFDKAEPEKPQSQALIVYEDVSSFINKLVKSHLQPRQQPQSPPADEKVKVDKTSDKSMFLSIDHPLVAALRHDRAMLIDMLMTIKINVTVRVSY